MCPSNLCLLPGRPRAGAAYLQGAYAPVHEFDVVDSELEVVEGALPPELDGAFLRIGPNPVLPPLNGYHWRVGRRGPLREQPAGWGWSQPRLQPLAEWGATCPPPPKKNNPPEPAGLMATG